MSDAPTVELITTYLEQAKTDDDGWRNATQVSEAIDSPLSTVKGVLQRMWYRGQIETQTGKVGGVGQATEWRLKNAES